MNPGPPPYQGGALPTELQQPTLPATCRAVVSTSTPTYPFASRLPRRHVRRAVALAEPTREPPTQERVKGIEPSSPAWKAGALPLSYTRKSLAVAFDTISTKQSHPPLSPRDHCPESQLSGKLGKSGECRIRTYEGRSQQIYSLSPLTAWVTPLCSRRTAREGTHEHTVSAKPRAGMRRRATTEPAKGLEPLTC